MNLRERRLEVYRDPIADVAASYGWRYERVETLPAGESIAPLALPSASITVADLLP